MPGLLGDSDDSLAAAGLVLHSLASHGFAVVSCTNMLTRPTHGQHEQQSSHSQLTLLDALQAEAAALLEQAEAACGGGGASAAHAAATRCVVVCRCSRACGSHAPPSVSPALGCCACRRGCIFQVLAGFRQDCSSTAHAQSADGSPAAYWRRRSTWPCQRAVAAWLRSPPLVALLQTALGTQQPLLYNGERGRACRWWVPLCSARMRLRALVTHHTHARTPVARRSHACLLPHRAIHHQATQPAPHRRSSRCLCLAHGWCVRSSSTRPARRQQPASVPVGGAG